MPNEITGVTNKNYNSLDLLKFICAFLVVGIHTEPFASIRIADMGFGLITRNAVPAFFVISSFLFFIKYPKIKDLLNYLKRIGIMYLIWICIYLIVNAILGDLIITSVPALLTSIFGGGGYSTLWFLQALLVAITIVFFLQKLVANENVVLIVCFILYLIGLVLSTYYPLFDSIPVINEIYNSDFILFTGTRNGLFYAPIFIAIGLKFSRTKWDHSRKFYLLGLIFSFVLLGIESGIGVLLLNVSNTILWLFMIPVAFFLFGFMVNLDLPDHKCFYFFRKTSTGIYLTHKLVINVIGRWIGGIILFVAVSVVSLLIATGLYGLSCRIRGKFWKYIL